MEYIITYFPEFEKAALKEVSAVDKNIRGRELSPNTALVSTDMNAENFINALVKSCPIFIRHIMPVLCKGVVGGDKDKDGANILSSTKEICGLQEGQFFSVQCRIINSSAEYASKDIEVCVGSYFESAGAVPKFSDYEILNIDVDVISILINGSAYYIGYSKASENLNSHSDEYRVLSRSSKEISRAENKLKEAICKFNLTVTGNGRALDMGASPGGWTKVLADYGYNVTAVDPAELHASLYKNKNVTHIKDRVENIIFEDKFEIIVNDMNVDPQITAKIMCGLAVNLAEGGLAVVTLKLPFSDIERSIRESVHILDEKYETAAIKNLSHNRREVTALLKLKQ